MIAAVLFEPLRQILLGHKQAARVEIADIQNNKAAAIAISRHIVNCGRATEAVPVEDRGGCLIDFPERLTRDDLGHTDRGLWETDTNGNPKDPWCMTDMLVMRETESGDLLTFTTSSQGDRCALGKLCQEFSKLPVRGFPVVELTAETYGHDSTARSKPAFKLVGWSKWVDSTGSKSPQTIRARWSHKSLTTRSRSNGRTRHNVGLGGKWQRGNYGLCRCPVHSDRTPSLKVSDSDTKSDGVDLYCFAGCDWKTIKDELRHQGILPEFSAGEVRVDLPSVACHHNHERGHTITIPRPRLEDMEGDDASLRHARA